MVAATIGGTASAITGNGFGSGAQTAAFQYLFNQSVSQQGLLRRLFTHNGRGPNDRHAIAVRSSIEAHRNAGFTILSEGEVEVAVPGHARPRKYDYVIRDEIRALNLGVEVKTTLGFTVRLDRRQVVMDTDVMRFGGTARPDIIPGGSIGAVSYRAFSFCAVCVVVDFRSHLLQQQLSLYGIGIEQGKVPGVYVKRP